jgi:UDP-GlcNAc3NAcA epimerase
VEAGLRSFNLAMPEEVNRVLTDRISAWLFCPTREAVDNLQREGFGRQGGAAPLPHIANVGDVMYDVAREHGARIQARGGVLAALETRGIRPGGYCLATIHRAENTDHPERMTALVEALAEFGRRAPVVWPVHPRTRTALERLGLAEAAAARLNLIDPVGYLDMVRLEKEAALIVTDSGGVQKEAFFHRVPCVTLRGETEWTELVEAGWNRLAPPGDRASIVAALRAAIGSRGAEVSPYGDGFAAGRIVQQIEKDLLR